MKRKVLIFIDWYLPGYKAGGPVQSVANLTAHLKNEFDFLVVTRDTDYTETQKLSGIKSNQWNNLNEYTKVFYFSEDQLNYPNIKKLIRETEFDVAYINGVYSLKFSILPLLALKNSKKRIVVAARGMLAESAINVKRKKKKFFINAAKLLGLYKNVFFHATNQTEAYDIIREINADDILVAPNLPKLIDIDAIGIHKEKASGVLKLFSVARISPEKNTKYALEVLTNCKGNIEFDLYGPVYNEEYWKECQQLINSMPPNIRVQHKGSLDSAQLISTIKNYHLLFMPTRGENFGHIILESFIAACPVIISDQTPWRNLQQKNIGFDISLLHPELFAETIDKLVNLSNEYYQEMAVAAQDYARQYLNNKENIELNKKLFA